MNKGVMMSDKHVYRVRITQTRVQDYLVRADNMKEASDIVDKAWEDGKIDTSSFESDAMSAAICEPGKIHLETCKYLN